MTQSSLYRTLVGSLLGGVSLLGVATPALAAQVLFSSDPALSGTVLAADQSVAVERGTTQVVLDNGALASFVGAAQFSVHGNGVVDLQTGAMTVVTRAGAPVEVSLPHNVRGVIRGANGAGSFSVGGGGSQGSAISGQVSLGIGSALKTYAPGAFWSAPTGQAPQRVVANAPTTTPDGGTVRSAQAGGIAAVAINGVPVAFGDALAATGASGDIVSAARRVQAFGQNPSLAAIPRADYATLTAYAAQAAAPYGGAAFNGAGADIVRTYFQYLATGAAAGTFQASYAKLLVNYLDLVRSGALPSGFSGATQVQLSAYIAFIGKTQGFGTLSSGNQTLLNAYLTFLQGGGTADTFATNASGLIGAYLDFVRGGGDPAQFSKSSAAIVSQYLAILQSSGIKSQLTVQNQALLTAFAANGNSVAFANGEATALAAFVGYLNKGGLPSQYTAVDAATLKSYLQTLSDTGLFDRLLGSQAGFLRSYLTYLQTGATADQFSQLPINVLTQQAGALNAYYSYIQNGGTPSLYTSLTQAQIVAYLTALQSAGLFNQLLGSASSPFLTDFLTYLQTGANPDIYGGLPNVDLTAYATQISAFVAYLKAGNLPANYSALTADQVRAYLNALSSSGKLAALNGADATFLSAYLAYLQGGGAPNAFSGLPIVTYQGYATALATYYAYLAGGGVPSAYTALTQAQVLAYLQELNSAGQVTALLGTNANFFANYYTFLNGGGAPDTYTGLSVFAPTPAPTSPFTQITSAKSYNTSISFAQTVAPATYSQGQLASTTSAIGFDANGNPSKFDSGSIASVETAQVAERAGNSAINIGRYTSGTMTIVGTKFVLSANQGVPYLLATPATNVPTSGLVDYSLLAATKPTYATGTSAPGTFDGKMRLAFGSTSRIAFLGTITMSDNTYSFGTQNEFDKVATAGQTILQPGNQIGSRSEPLTATSGDCALSSPCAIIFSGFLSGASGQYAGVTYQTSLGYNGTSNKNPERINGAAIFGAPGATLSGTTTPTSSTFVPTTPAGTGAGSLATATSVAFDSAGSSIGTPGTGESFGVNTASANINALGELQSVIPQSGSTVKSGTAVNTDVYANGTIAVGRWTNGTVSQTTPAFGTTPASTVSTTLSANQGISYAVALPIAALPASGNATYNLLAATRPAVANGVNAPGTLTSATLAVTFGASSHLGFEAMLAMPEASGTVNYAISSTGGIANPAASDLFFFKDAFNPTGGFEGSLTATPGSATNVGCSNSSTCSGYLSGAVAGTNASNAIVSYIFGKDAPTNIAGSIALSGSGTTSNSPTVGTGAPTGTVLFARTEGVNSARLVTVDAQTSGALNRWDAPVDNGIRNTATDQGNGGLAGVIGWSRWAGGTTGGVYAATYSTNGGIAHIWGTPATNIPTSGVATYRTTVQTPIFAPDGSLPVGNVNAGILGVDFGTQKVGLTSNVAIGNGTIGGLIDISTAGGSAAPSLSLNANGTFAGALTAANGQVRGFLAGPGAGYAGLAFTVPSTALGLPGTVVSGVMAFTKGP